MNWKAEDIEKLKLKNNLPKIKKIPKVSVEKQTIKTVLWVLRKEGIIPDYVEELKFHPKRKFRFDWAIPDLKLAIEYEGLFSKKSGHTTPRGFTSDCEKYNLAQIQGWTVLRYTAMNHQELERDIKKFMENV